MSRWTDQFANHQIHSTIHALQEWLEVEVGEIDAEHEEERRRIKKYFDLISFALNGQDPELFPQSLPENELSDIKGL